jgi:hypothetical protein
VYGVYKGEGRLQKWMIQGARPARAKQDGERPLEVREVLVIRCGWRSARRTEHELSGEAVPLDVVVGVVIGRYDTVLKGGRAIVSATLGHDGQSQRLTNCAIEL